MGQHPAIALPASPTAKRQRLVGVLGGMGPLATVDFLRKLIELTPARRDQDHVPVIVRSVPQIPDRSQCIEGNGPSPLPALLLGLRALEAAGAEIIVMPCNTAHYWHAAMKRQSRAEFPHIAETAIAALGRQGITGGRIGLLATTGTILADIYGAPLTEAGYTLVLPSARRQEDLVMAGIRAVKAGSPVQAQRPLAAAVADLAAQDVRAVILGCTEVPLGLPHAGLPPGLPLIDAAETLASACVALSRIGSPAGTISEALAESD